MTSIKQTFGLAKLDKTNKMMFAREIDVTPIIEPDEIIWENLSYTIDEQKARRYSINVFSVVFLLMNTLFTMYLSGFKSYMNRTFPSPVGCPVEEIEKEAAYVDMLKDFDEFK